MLVRVAVEGVYYDGDSKSPVVMLKEIGGERRVPIWIGAFEAMAILIGMEAGKVPRPITHDTAALMVRSLGGSVARVELTRMEEGVYYSVVHLTDGEGGLHEIDARPSDALALGLRFAAPVYVATDVFTAASKVGRYKDKDGEYWKKYLEGLDSEAFGKYRM